MTVVSVIARLMTVKKLEGKTDATLISRGENRKVKATYKLKEKKKWRKQLQRVSVNLNGSVLLR